MVFSSSSFLFLFLPICLLGYFLVPKKIRNLYLILISLGFFATTGKKALVFFVLFILINYFFGLVLYYAKSKLNPWASKVTLFTAIASNVFFLLYLKYSKLFITTLNEVSGANVPLVRTIAVLGISFFTFSAISYLLDINSGKISNRVKLLDFSLYMSFFPKLLQGPIARFGDFQKQREEGGGSIDDFSRGAYRFTVGLAKKVIIADQLGTFVNYVFSMPTEQISTWISWTAAAAYALQIYFDFSGYTDMAIGMGRIFGITLPENFNFPYISTSISEFWRRWHITLSSWFRDYLFIPLEFKRRRTKFLRTESNVLIVFLLTGFWHGASWNFLVWGLWHGLFISIEVFLKSRKIKLKIPYFIKLIGTLVILIVGWVIFRSTDLAYAMKYIGVMFGAEGSQYNWVYFSPYLNTKTILLIFIGIIACIPWEKILPNFFNRFSDSKSSLVVRTVSMVVLLILSLIYVLSATYVPFIYFQF